MLDLGNAYPSVASSIPTERKCKIDGAQDLANIANRSLCRQLHAHTYVTMQRYIRPEILQFAFGRLWNKKWDCEGRKIDLTTTYTTLPQLSKPNFNVLLISHAYTRLRKSQQISVGLAFQNTERKILHLAPLPHAVFFRMADL